MAASTSIDDDNGNRNTSLSYFQTTVCLQDWWLIKSEKEIEGKSLAVAGFTSRDQQALRQFSSAPIRKRFDAFTLETTDGICVMIKGFIDKVRTKENGFSSEVFRHFLFGFPPHWDQCAEKFMVGGSATDDVSEGNQDIEKIIQIVERGSSEVYPEIYEKTIRKVSHADNENLNVGIEDSGNLVVKDQHHSRAHSNSSELGDVNVSSASYVDLSTVKTSTGPEIQIYPSRMMEGSVPCETRFRNKEAFDKNERIGNRMQNQSDSSESEHTKSFDSNDKIDCVEMESGLTKSSNVGKSNLSNDNKTVFMEMTCINTRSLQKTYSSKRNDSNVTGRSEIGSTYFVSSFQNLEVRICNEEHQLGSDDSILLHAGVGEIERLGLRPSTEDLPANYVDDIVLQCKGVPGEEGSVVAPPIVDMEENTTERNHKIKRNYKLKKLRGGQKVAAASDCNVKNKSCESHSALEALDKLDNNNSSLLPLEFGGKKDISEERASHSKSKGRFSECLSRCSKGIPKDDQTTVNVLEDERRKFKSVSVCGSGKLNKAASAGSEEIPKNISIMLDTELQDPTDEIKSRISYTGCMKDCKSVRLSASVGVSKLNQSCGEIMVKAGAKMLNKTIRDATRLVGADKKEISVSKQGCTLTEATTTKKTKQKLIYESPVTPRRKDLSSVVLPDFLSCKRSRSGRLLLPTLEFWRNQTAIYDADRQITGIKAEQNVLPRGSKSGSQRNRKRHK